MTNQIHPHEPVTTGPYSGLTLRSAKRFLQKQFENAGLDFAEEDARDLVLAITGLNPVDYMTRGTDYLTEVQSTRLFDAASDRLSGTPVDRILGWREFFGRRFTLSPDGLSPRADTEILLLAALEAIRTIAAPQCLDLGTGTGALAISLLCERRDAAVLATDISQAVLGLCQLNAERHNLGDRLQWLQSDWFDALEQRSRFDAILSNPPYISAEAMDALEREVSDHDPKLALYGGPDGLDAYRAIIPQARAYLKPGGWLGVEIGFDQAERVSTLFEQAGYNHIAIRKDPAGLDRCVCARSMD